MTDEVKNSEELKNNYYAVVYKDDDLCFSVDLCNSYKQAVTNMCQQAGSSFCYSPSHRSVDISNNNALVYYYDNIEEEYNILQIDNNIDIHEYSHVIIVYKNFKYEEESYSLEFFKSYEDAYEYMLKVVNIVNDNGNAFKKVEMSETHAQVDEELVMVMFKIDECIPKQD